MTWKTISHSLAYPVNLNGVTISAISMREPDIDALEVIDDLGIIEGEKLKVKQIRGIISALSDQPDAVIGKLHRADMTALGELLAPLLVGVETTVVT